MKRVFVLVTALVMALSLAACGGDAEANEGRVNDTMETYFFDFTVNSAYLTADYEGYTPAEGNVLLVAPSRLRIRSKRALRCMIRTSSWPGERKMTPTPTQ